MEYTKLKHINEYKSKNINPSKMPNTIFEMYSVPIYETGHPEYLRGDQIASNKAIVQKNDILLCKINPRLNRVWIVSDESDNTNIASSEWIVIRSNDYNPEFLAWYFRTSKFQKLMTSEVTGIGGSLMRAQPKRVAEYPVPIVTKAFQDEVVSILNKCKCIMDFQKHELELLDELVRARFVEMFGDPVVNDKNWEILKLKNLSTKIGSGSTPRGGKESYIDDGISFIRSMNVREGVFDYANLAHINDNQAKKLNNVIVEKNDVLLNITGASVARCCVVPENVLPARVNQHVCIIRCKKNIQAEFLSDVLNNKSYQRYLLRLAESGATREAINKQQIEQLNIIIPPLSLQNQFADFVHEVDKSRLHVLYISQLQFYLKQVI